MRTFSIQIILIFVGLMVNLLSAQQTICQGSIHEYGVDKNENNGNGTEGSTYRWEVLNVQFSGEIIPPYEGANRIQINWKDTLPGNYTLIVYETSASGCISTSQVVVSIEETPDIEMITQYICPDGGQVLLTAPEGFDQFEWTNSEGDILGNTSEIVVNQSGTYYLQLYNGKCYYQYPVEVSEVNLPTLEIETDEDDNVIISAIGGDGPYLYQLENLEGEIIRTYQPSNIFFDVSPGMYIVRIQTTKGFCEVTDLAIVLYIPNIFTPNDDKVNDHWQIKGLIFFPNSTVEIFDRFGKIISTLDTNSLYIWDGKYMGRAIPSDNYWYKITFENSKTRMGWVTVKNRDTIF